MPGRVLLPSWDGGGNTTPAYHLALRLLRRDHEVLMIGWPSMAPRAERDAIPFTSYPTLPPWPEGLPLEHDDFSLMDQMVHGEQTTADIIAIAQEFQPDVLVLDCMMGAGFRAAPWAFLRQCCVMSSTHHSSEYGETGHSKEMPPASLPRWTRS